MAQELDQADPTPTEQTTPTPTPTTEVTPDPTPTEQITPSPDPTPTPTVELTPTPTEAPSPDPTPTPTEEINPTPTEQITPTPELTPGITPTPVITPTQSWTHTNLALNQTYTAPQNDKVKITFNKLPQSSGNILIREIKLTQQQVELTNAVSDTAYDITSDMQDGTFSYNLELPLPESISTKEVEMVYANNLDGLDSAKSIENETIEEKSVSANNIDHFTIFINTYKDASLTIPQPVYLQGDIVYLRATGLVLTHYYKLAINPPGDSNTFGVTSCQTNIDTLNGQYTLPADANISNQWQAEVHGYETNENCTDSGSLSSSHHPSDDQTFEVTDKVNVCHKTNSGANPWVVQEVNANQLQSHLDNGDFLYEGPLKDNGHPDQKAADDWCNANIPTSCGDSIVQEGEQCDLGTGNGTSCNPAYGLNCQSCSSTCQNVTETGPFCGDNVKNGTEQCDGAAGVGEHQSCDDQCTLVDLPYCGNGTPDQETEACDDGNNLDGDGCSSICTPETSSVEICKKNPSGAPMSGWKVALKGESAGSVMVYPSNNSGSTGGTTNMSVSSAALATGNYILEALGYYTYRGTTGAEYTDAVFSKRSPSDSIYGGPFIPWVNVTSFPLPYTGWLGIQVNGLPTNWNNYLSSDHKYLLGFSGYTGPFTFTILDDVYSDNSGQIPVNIYKGYAGYTGDDGCITFADVPFGNYSVDEVIKEGWRNVSGIVSVNIDSSTEHFELVNEQTVPSPYCGDGQQNQSSEECDEGNQNGIECTPQYGNSCTYCSASCTTQTLDGPSCGDQIVNGEEQCDGSSPITCETTNGYQGTQSCDTSCSWDTCRTTESCGDGIVNGEEQCDGTSGVTPGQNFCSATCNLIPTYSGPNSCSNGKIKGDLVATGTISSTSPTGIVLGLTANNEYLFEASNTFIPTSAPGYISDSGFTWINSILSTQYGINGSGPDLGAHALLADLGLGVGIVKWATAPTINNVYGFAYTPTNSNQQFVIGDRFGDWFNTPYQNQSGMNDNQGSLNLNVYSCIDAPGNIIIEKQTLPNGSGQTFTFSSSYDNDGFILSDGQTNDSGSISSGTYSVSESLPSGWTQESVTCTDGSSPSSIELAPGETVTCTFTNTATPVTIIASKIVCDSEDLLPNWGNHGSIIDANTAANYVATHPGCHIEEDWNFQWANGGTGTFDSFQTNTDLLNNWTTFGSTSTISDLTNIGGHIETREVFPNNDYVPFSGNDEDNVSAEFYCSGDVYHYDNWEWINNPQYGNTYYCVGFNALKSAKLTVIKYSDDDQDGRRGEDERTLSDWEINLGQEESEGQTTKTTGETGSVSFDDLIPGSYNLSEEQQEGWNQSNIFCPEIDEEVDERYTQSRDIYLSPDADITCYIGNYTDPGITISKFNDASSDESPGGSVVYRILLKITKANLKKLTVKDLLPEGFKYRLGSYHAWLNGSTLDIEEPEYHSPGIWEIDGVEMGDEIELVYTADIGSTQEPGLYKDVVWAQGTSLSDNQVLALATADGFVDQNFSGTEVNVIKDQTQTENYSIEKEEIQKVTGQVLGASTDLPATGANTYILFFALLNLGLGIQLIRSSKKADEK